MPPLNLLAKTFSSKSSIRNRRPFPRYIQIFPEVCPSAHPRLFGMLREVLRQAAEFSVPQFFLTNKIHKYAFNPLIFREYRV